jgi:hypothetical protein
MPKVTIATTMWSEVGEEIGARREAQLKEEDWKHFLTGGCKMGRFEDTLNSAWEIVGSDSGTSLLFTR